MSRLCNGAAGDGVWCGAVARVVCTDASGGQWLACDRVVCQRGARHTEPVVAWFARLGLWYSDDNEARE